MLIWPEGKGNVIGRCKVKPGENVPAMRSCVCECFCVRRNE